MNPKTKLSDDTEFCPACAELEIELGEAQRKIYRLFDIESGKIGIGDLDWVSDPDLRDMIIKKAAMDTVVFGRPSGNMRKPTRPDMNSPVMAGISENAPWVFKAIEPTKLEEFWLGIITKLAK